MRKVMGLRRKHWMLVAAVGGLAAVLALMGARLAGPASGQTTTVQVVSPATASVGATVSVGINVNDVTNLGTYEWVLAYNPDVLELAGGTNPVNGPFLATTGRSAYCPPPIVDTDVGTARFGCVSSPPPDTGSSGSGVLSTVTFNAKAAGGSSLCLSWASLGDASVDVNDIPLSPSQYQHGSIIVGGGSAPPSCPPAATPTPATPTPVPFSGVIPARASSVTVHDQRVGARSHITVTLTSDPGRSTCWFGRCFAMGAPPAVSWVEPLAGQGFVVHLTSPVGRDTTFTYSIETMWWPPPP